MTHFSLANIIIYIVLEKSKNSNKYCSMDTRTVSLIFADIIPMFPIYYSCNLWAIKWVHHEIDKGRKN